MKVCSDDLLFCRGTRALVFTNQLENIRRKSTKILDDDISTKVVFTTALIIQDTKLSQLPKYYLYVVARVEEQASEYHGICPDSDVLLIVMV